MRDGHDAGFTELYVRHHGVARRIARTYRYRGDADDLVNEAFEKVYAALRRGSGPTGSFRAYLFVTMRRLAAERSERPSEDLLDELPEPVAAARKAPVLDSEEREIITEAYESLPDRAQAVLWYTAVEGRNPRDLSDRLGMTPNAVSALAYRAREQLRQAYLQAHLRTAHPQCEPHRSGLGAYVRDGQSRRDRLRTERHVEHCPRCQGLVAELSEVNRLLVRAVAPLFLMGSLRRVVSAAGAASTAAASQAAGPAGEGLKRLPAALGWVKGAAGTAGGVAAAAAMLGGLAVTGSLLARDDVDQPVAIRPAVNGASPTSSTSPPPPPPATAAPPPTEVESEPCAPPTSDETTSNESTSEAPTTPTSEPRSTTGLSVEVPVSPEAIAETLGETAAATEALALDDPLCSLDAANRTGELTLSLANLQGQPDTSATSAEPLVDLAGVKLTVALSDGVLAVDAELPVGCEILHDGHTVQCTLDEALVGEATTLGLELLGDSDELATVTLERDGQAIEVRAVELLSDLTGSLTSVLPSIPTSSAPTSTTNGPGSAIPPLAN